MPSQTVNDVQTILGWVPLVRPKFIGLNFVSDTSTGDRDLYTCPTGRRAMVMFVSIRNAGTGTMTVYAEVKNGGTYYRITTNTSVAIATISTIDRSIILDAGETYAINVSQTTPSTTVWAQIIEFDASSPIKRSGLLSMAAGNNTLYTVPSGMMAVVLGAAYGAGTDFNAQSPGIVYVNDSGGTRTWITYAVPSGQSIGAGTQTAASTTTADKTRVVISGAVAGATLAAGDAIVINLDASTAKQVGWVNVAELPVPNL